MPVVEGIDTLTRLIVPQLDETVVRARSQVRFVSLTAEIDAVDTRLVTNERIVGS